MVTMCLVSALVASSILGLVLRPRISQAAPLLSNADDPEEQRSFFEGDIITKIQHSPNEVRGRNLVSNPEFLWPNKTLTYELSSEFKPMEKKWIEQALHSLQNSTCVRFVQRTTEEHYMFVHNDVGCASPVGFHHGRVDMFLSLPGCIRWGTIQHEFLHALGFWHEHTRPDRNLYVAIQWENIVKGMEINFAARTASESQNEGLPYDYGSVMHYRTIAFSRNRDSPTIIPLQKGVVIGQRKKYSKLDLAKLNRLYDCGREYFHGDDLVTVPDSANTEAAKFTTDGLETTTSYSVSASYETATSSPVASTSTKSSSRTSSSTKSFHTISVSTVSASSISSDNSEISAVTATSAECNSVASSKVDSSDISLVEIATTINLNTNNNIKQLLLKNKAVTMNENSLVKNSELQQIKKKFPKIIFKILRKKRHNYFPRLDSSIDLPPSSTPITHYWYNSPQNERPEIPKHQPSSCPCRNHNKNQRNYHEQQHLHAHCNTYRQSSDRQDCDGRSSHDRRYKKDGRKIERNGDAGVSKNRPAPSNEDTGEFETGKRKEKSAESYDYSSLDSLDTTSKSSQYGPAVVQHDNDKNKSLVRDQI